MGASVSICNLTAVIINISLKQVSPLYYENKVLPSNCATFQTGRVWFTVEARIWANGSNDYNEAQKILPAAGLGLLVPPLVAGVAVAIHGSASPTTPPPSNQSSGNMSASITVPSHAIVAGSMIATLPGGVITAAGAIVNMDHTPSDWSVRKGGVYMKEVTKIQITGGPSAGNVTISRPNKKWQKIQVDSFDPLQIEVKE